jgi:hypothetical protein
MSTDDRCQLANFNQDIVTQHMLLGDWQTANGRRERVGGAQSEHGDVLTRRAARKLDNEIGDSLIYYGLKGVDIRITQSQLKSHRYISSSEPLRVRDMRELQSTQQGIIECHR